MSRIRELWDEHRQFEFPEGLATKRILGIDLLFLSSNMESCVRSFLASGGMLEPDRVRYLSTCYRELDLVLSSVEGAAQDHLIRLQKVARLMLEDQGVETTA